MTDTKGIGCGIWPLILTDTVFASACEWHDEAYMENSWAQKNITREQTDHWFLSQMLVIAGDDEFLQQEAYFFYRVARTLGKHFWEGGQFFAPAGVMVGVTQIPTDVKGEAIISVPSTEMLNNAYEKAHEEPRKFSEIAMDILKNKYPAHLIAPLTPLDPDPQP